MNSSTVFDPAHFFHIQSQVIGDLVNMFIYLMLNLMTVYIIVRYFYLKSPDNKHYSFSYFTVSTIVFLLVYLLENVRFELSLALGLFAIFGIIRYRTDSIPMKEITYLFVLIGVSVINAITNVHISLLQLVIVNAFVILSAGLMESDLIFHRELYKKVRYDRIDLILPGRYEELLSDLKERTGLNITQVEIGSVDFLRDSAEITIYYNLK